MKAMEERLTFRIRQTLLEIRALQALIVYFKNAPALSEHQLLHGPK